MAGNKLVRFWGVRGSVPSPLTGAQVEDKIVHACCSLRGSGLQADANEDQVRAALQNLPFHQRSTFGGNTTCVELVLGGQRIILDMGTGLRPLGNSLFPEMFRDGGLHLTVLQSHVHWDHIQGLPFFAPLYMPRSKFHNHVNFFGGKDWDKSLHDVLLGQMEDPVFPVNFADLSLRALDMQFNGVYDGWEHTITADGGEIRITCRVLDHPQETYGYRVEFDGWVLAFTTDHEPRGGDYPMPALVELARDADVWVTDCQYSFHQYTGKEGGVPRFGWGHSYPEYIAAVARKAKPKHTVTFHHDPAADDLRVTNLATEVETLCQINTSAAYEGMKVTA